MVVSLTGKGKIGAKLESLGVQVVALNMTSVFSVFRVIVELTQKIKSHNPCFVHTWMYHANVLGGIGAVLSRQRNIIWSIRRSAYVREESLSTFLY